jgi:hypothetical protein
VNDKVDLLLARQAPAAPPVSGPTAPSVPPPPPAPPAPEKTLTDFPEDEVIAFALPLIEQRLGFRQGPA